MVYPQSHYDRRIELSSVIAELYKLEKRLAMVCDNCEGMHWTDVCNKLHQVMADLKSGADEISEALDLADAKNGT